MSLLIAAFIGALLALMLMSAWSDSRKNSGPEGGFSLKRNRAQSEGPGAPQSAVPPPAMDSFRPAALDAEPTWQATDEDGMEAIPTAASAEPRLRNVLRQLDELSQAKTNYRRDVGQGLLGGPPSPEASSPTVVTESVPVEPSSFRPLKPREPQRS